MTKFLLLALLFTFSAFAGTVSIPADTTPLAVNKHSGFYLSAGVLPETTETPVLSHRPNGKPH